MTQQQSYLKIREIERDSEQMTLIIYLTMNAIVRPWVCTQCAAALPRSTRVSLRRNNLIRHLRNYTAHNYPRDGRPFRMAVIGSGPAGFYTSLKVMSKIENSVVDMYEHLPVPFGLVRFGVAPDHPEVKVGLLLL